MRDLCKGLKKFPKLQKIDQSGHIIPVNVAFFRVDILPTSVLQYLYYSRSKKCKIRWLYFSLFWLLKLKWDISLEAIYFDLSVWIWRPKWDVKSITKKDWAGIPSTRQRIVDTTGCGLRISALCYKKVLPNHKSIKTVNFLVLSSCFFKWAIPDLFFVYFRLFKQRL